MGLEVRPEAISSITPLPTVQRMHSRGKTCCQAKTQHVLGTDTSCVCPRGVSEHGKGCCTIATGCLKVCQCPTGSKQGNKVKTQAKNGQNATNTYKHHKRKGWASSRTSRPGQGLGIFRRIAGIYWTPFRQVYQAPEAKRIPPTTKNANTGKTQTQCTHSRHLGRPSKVSNRVHTAQEEVNNALQLLSGWK